jgi:hypothetical protein
MTSTTDTPSRTQPSRARPTTATFSDRSTARIVGILILTATTTYMIGSGLIESVVTLPDFLTHLDANRTAVLAGVLFEMVNAAVIVGAGVLMFPVLRRHSPAVALGYAGTRIIECTLLVVACIATLSLIPLSQELVAAGAGDASSVLPLASVLVAQSESAFHMAMTALGVGSIPMCYLLYRTRLVPRPIAALGVAGYVFLVGNGVLVASGADMGITLFLPGALFELAFPFWLIVKGFNASFTPAAATATMHQDR